MDIFRNGLLWLVCSLTPAAYAATCEELLFANGFENVDVGCSDSPLLTYRLNESANAVALWTTPVAHKVRAGDPLPPQQQSGLLLHAARHEFEPVQLIVGALPGSVSATASVAPFPALGASQRIDMTVARYENNGWPEDLEPLSPNGAFTLNSGQPTPLWITVYVPPNAPPGEHNTTLTLTLSGRGTFTIPLKLYVFDFALPQTISFATQFNYDLNEPQHELKQLLFEHRLNPKTVTWPSGFRYNITWDSGANPNRCQTFYDEPDESPEFSVGALARRYILGEGWNGVGFPNALLFQFVDGGTPRPGVFCGINRGGHFGSAAYNAEWAQFLTALRNYLAQNGMLAKGYYYVMDEPQDQDDYDVAAFLCRLTRTAAPDLRIAISEEPKPQIAEHAAGACGYDIWIAHIGAYLEDYAHQRQRDHGETVWYYSLPQDAEPFFNPTESARQGMDVRIIPWVAWRYRITGWAYFDGESFFDGRDPNIRGELLREGLEDYEYLYLANGGRHPRVDVSEPGDTPALSAAKTLNTWTRDADALMALRYQLGRYIQGSSSELPALQRQGSRPRAAYYLNFQDPNGQPTANPLVVGGKTYIKIGWQAYNSQLGYGWRGEHVGEPDITLYGYRSNAGGYSPVERSYLYDDYGRLSLFEYELENGRYQVTVAVGLANGGSSDPHNVTLEGSKIVDEVSSDDLIVRTATVELTDGSLSLEIGGRSALTGDYAYTFLAYMDIVPAD